MFKSAVFPHEVRYDFNFTPNCTFLLSPSVHSVHIFIIGKQCGNLTAPANGSVDIIPGYYWRPDMVSGKYGDKAVFRCDHCYEFEKNGPSTVELSCESSGEWNGTEPTCQSKLSCPIFTSVFFGCMTIFFVTIYS